MVEEKAKSVLWNTYKNVVIQEISSEYLEEKLHRQIEKAKIKKKEMKGKNLSPHIKNNPLDEQITHDYVKSYHLKHYIFKGLWRIKKWIWTLRKWKHWLKILTR